MSKRDGDQLSVFSDLDSTKSSQLSSRGTVLKDIPSLCTEQIFEDPSLLAAQTPRCGLRFATRDLATWFIEQHEGSGRHVMEYDRAGSGGCKVLWRCSGRIAVDTKACVCGAFYDLRKRTIESGREFWVLHEMDTTHGTCGHHQRKMFHAREFVSNPQLAEMMLKNPKAALTDCLRVLHGDDVTPQQAARAKKMLKEDVLKKQEEKALQILPSYLAELARDNPGTRCSLQYITKSNTRHSIHFYVESQYPIIPTEHFDSHLQCAFIVPSWSAPLAAAAHPVYSVDCTHYVAAEYFEGHIMSLTALVAGERVVLAAGLVNSENKENYQEFLSMIKKVIPHLSEGKVSFCTDRNQGLESVLEGVRDGKGEGMIAGCLHSISPVIFHLQCNSDYMPLPFQLFSDAWHQACFQHLFCNVVRYCGGSKAAGMRELLYGVVTASNLERFNIALKKLIDIMPMEVKTKVPAVYLLGLARERWCMMDAAEKGFSMFGITTSNSVEGWNADALALGLRCAFAGTFFIRLVEHMRRKIVKLQGQLHQMRGVVLPSVVGKIHKQAESILKLEVRETGNGQFLVWTKGTDGSRYRVVDVHKVTCSCLQMVLQGHPCRHFSAVAAKMEWSNTEAWWTASCHPSFRVNVIRNAVDFAARNWKAPTQFQQRPIPLLAPTPPPTEGRGRPSHNKRAKTAPQVAALIARARSSVQGTVASMAAASSSSTAVKPGPVQPLNDATSHIGDYEAIEYLCQNGASADFWENAELNDIFRELFCVAGDMDPYLPRTDQPSNECGDIGSVADEDVVSSTIFSQPLVRMRKKGGKMGERESIFGSLGGGGGEDHFSPEQFEQSSLEMPWGNDGERPVGEGGNCSNNNKGTEGSNVLWFFSCPQESIPNMSLHQLMQSAIAGEEGVAWENPMTQNEAIVLDEEGSQAPIVIGEGDDGEEEKMKRKKPESAVVSTLLRKARKSVALDTSVAGVRGPCRPARGLGNLGLTCFLNAFLQCLFSLEAFRSALLQWRLSSFDSEGSGDDRMPIVRSLQATLVAMGASPDHSPCPCIGRNALEKQQQQQQQQQQGNQQQKTRKKKTKDAYSAHLPPDHFCPEALLGSLPEMFERGVQHDSFEVGRFLLNCIEEMAGHGSRHPAQLFDWSIEWETRCLDCDKSNVREERVRDLALAIPLRRRRTKFALLELVGKACEWETMDEAYECSTCPMRTRAERRMRLRRLPSCLIISLGRFSFNKGGGGKIMAEVEFPQQMQLQESSSASQQVNDVHYELGAIVVHRGLSLESGHYFSFCRNSSDDQRQWYRYDDTRVTRSSWDEISNMTTRNHADLAYVLMYHRPQPTIVEEEEEEQEDIEIAEGVEVEEDDVDIVDVCDDRDDEEEGGEANSTVPVVPLLNPVARPFGVWRRPGGGEKGYKLQVSSSMNLPPVNGFGVWGGGTQRFGPAVDSMGKQDKSVELMKKPLGSGIIVNLPTAKRVRGFSRGLGIGKEPFPASNDDSNILPDAFAGRSWVEEQVRKDGGECGLLLLLFASLARFRPFQFGFFLSVGKPAHGNSVAFVRGCVVGDGFWDLLTARMATVFSLHAAQVEKIGKNDWKCPTGQFIFDVETQNRLLDMDDTVTGSPFACSVRQCCTQMFSEYRNQLSAGQVVWDGTRYVTTIGRKKRDWLQATAASFFATLIFSGMNNVEDGGGGAENGVVVKETVTRSSQSRGRQAAGAAATGGLVGREWWVYSASEAKVVDARFNKGDRGKALVNNYTSSGVHLFESDFLTLRRGFLSGEVISAYCCILRKSMSRSGVKIWNPRQYQNAQETKPTMRRRHFERADVTLTDAQFAIIPSHIKLQGRNAVNIDHWNVIYMLREKKTLQIFDSFGVKNPSKEDIVQPVLDVLELSESIEDWSVEIAQNVPKQKESECGIFALAFVHCLATESDITAVSAADIPALRYFFANQIMKEYHFK